MTQNIKNETPSATQQIVERTKFLINTGLRHWKRIAVFVVGVNALVALYIFSLPREYTSVTTMLPETQSSMSLSEMAGSLASIAGIKLNNKSEDAISPEIYPKLFASSGFLYEVMQSKVKVKRLGTEVTIFDYFANKQKEPWWSVLTSWTKDDNPLLLRDLDPLRPNKKQQKIFDALEGAFFCGVDKKTDMITVSVSAQDAEVAMQIASLMQEKLQEYITNYRTSKTRNDLNYIKKIAHDTETKYKKAQQKYAAYSDSHNDLVLSAYKQEMERLENEMQLAYNAYQFAAQQLQMASAKVQERTPVYTVLQQAQQPFKPSKPKRMLTMLFSLIFTTFIALTWFAVKDKSRMKVVA